MKSKREKFESLISNKDDKTVSRNKERIKNRARLKESRAIALKVLSKLDNLGWTQRKLANEMNVSPQQVTKIVKGKENLTLETQIKLQKILDIPILATYYERNSRWKVEFDPIERVSKYVKPQSTISLAYVLTQNVKTKQYKTNALTESEIAFPMSA